MRAIRPSAGLELQYRKRLQALLEAVHRSVIYWIAAEYKKHPPALAQDANPFDFLRRYVERLKKRWLKRLDDAAPKLAEYFATSVQKRSDTQLKKILKDAGFLVSFQKTPAMMDAWDASVAENVSLIKAVPTEYLSKVEQTVSRAYANGYDMKRLSDELQENFGVEKRRAARIAKDQCSKLNVQMQKARAVENGLEHALWSHSYGAKEPRRTHLEMDGEPFEIATGMYDPDPKVQAMVWPGSLIGCGCTMRILVPFGKAWEEAERKRSIGLVKPVREQKIHKGGPKAK